MPAGQNSGFHPLFDFWPNFDLKAKQPAFALCSYNSIFYVLDNISMPG